MFLILLNWLFIYVTLLGSGYLVRAVVRRWPGFAGSNEPTALLLIAGIIPLTFVGYLLNFFIPISAFARYVVVAVSIMSVIHFRHEVVRQLKRDFDQLAGFHIAVKVMWLVIVIIALVKAAGPTELIDEGRYYLPYIRWIEEYRLVPGIANIEERFAFNSSVHLLGAFFSMREFYTDGFYELNGFMLVVITGFFLRGTDKLLKRLERETVADYVKTVCMFFLLRNMLTAPASDFINVFFAEVMLVLFIDKITRGNLAVCDFDTIMILLIPVFLVTVKFSSIGLLIIPVLLLIRRSVFAWKLRSFFIVSAFLFLTVWMVRGYFLSGYPVYPLYQVDFFHPDWKVYEKFAVDQYNYIRDFARMNGDITYGQPVLESNPGLGWVSGWFASINHFEKLVFVLLSVTVMVNFLLIMFRSEFRRKFGVLSLVLVLNLANWFYNYPAFRFGWGIILVFLALTLTELFATTRWSDSFRIGVICILSVFLLQASLKTYFENQKIISQTFIKPFPLPQPELKKVSWNDNFQFEVSSTHECWGAHPPCFPDYYDREVKMRGDKITDGFYFSMQEVTEDYVK